MALVKGSFKVYGKQDIQTKYLAFDGTNKKSVDPDKKKSDGSLLENYPLGKINPQKKCIPAGTFIKFDTSSGGDKTAIPAGKTEVTGSSINDSVYLLAEDLYHEDEGMVYWYIEDVNNLEVK